MMRTITLADGVAELVVVPSLGAGVAFYDSSRASDGSGRVAILRVRALSILLATDVRYVHAGHKADRQRSAGERPDSTAPKPAVPRKICLAPKQPLDAKFITV